MQFIRRGFVPAVALAGLILAGCGGGKPSAEDFRKAVDAELQASMQQMGAVFGVKMAPADMPAVVAVENIRKKDDATFVADVTMAHKKSGMKETDTVALRKIENRWQIVKQ
jgi:protein-disulfide isomerase-like protein with CxxC motif